jgi:hypothetical protein
MTAKEWMQDMFKVFGPCEYKAEVYTDKGSMQLKSKGYREDPPNLKEFKAIDCILPVYLREAKPQAKNDKKKVIKQVTKYKEIV